MFTSNATATLPDISSKKALTWIPREEGKKAILSRVKIIAEYVRIKFNDNIDRFENDLKVIMGEGEDLTVNKPCSISYEILRTNNIQSKVSMNSLVNAIVRNIHWCKHTSTHSGWNDDTLMALRQGH